MDLLRSERGIVTLVFMFGLLALLLVPGVERWKIELWTYGAGGLAATYVGFKSIRPNDAPKPGVVKAETAEPGSEVIS